VGDTHELEDFYHWLRGDVDVVRAGTVTTTGLADAGRMGAFETVSMVLSNTTGLASLAIAYSSWRRARKSPLAFTFTPTDEPSPQEQAVIDEMNRPQPDGGDE
jgi:hypothetical protein